jgi:hypothetical protein
MNSSIVAELLNIVYENLRMQNIAVLVRKDSYFCGHSEPRVGNLQQLSKWSLFFRARLPIRQDFRRVGLPAMRSARPVA